MERDRLLTTVDRRMPTRRLHGGHCFALWRSAVRITAACDIIMIEREGTRPLAGCRRYRACPIEERSACA